MKVIEVKNLVKKFGNKKVLNEINFSVDEGKIFGFLGPSGAGKTTLIKMLIGEYSITDGEIYVFGKKPPEFNDEIVCNISAIMDNFGLYERLNVYDNMEVFCNIYRKDKSEIDKLLKKVELYDARKTIVSKLSKGMRERLLIARGLINHPKLLFLDEPTAGLDPATSLKIHDLLFELKKKGTTIFLTTHNMEEATKMCDEVALLNLGKIVEFGVPKDLCIKYNKNEDIDITTKDGKEIILNAKKDRNKIIDLFDKDNILSIHSKEPTLETIFIELTGKELV